MSNNRGFTLIEVMISLGIFSLLIIIFATSVPLARKSSQVNGQYAQAISLCQHKIDQMRAVGYGRINYTELSDAEIIDESPSASPFSFAGVDNVDQYLPQPTATVNVHSMSTDKIIVTVTVTWKNATHESKTSTASLSAIITNVE
ncbi:MAG: type II secretion system protein [Armatimonadota bacterium]